MYAYKCVENRKLRLNGAMRVCITIINLLGNKCCSVYQTSEYRKLNFQSKRYIYIGNLLQVVCNINGYSDY